MTNIEDHFTVFVRLPFNRGDFIDPPPVSWSATKERALWDIISRQSKSNEIHWRNLSEKFEVTQNFLLQQAAWLYERQLSQVRAQMRRVGSRQSASPLPNSTTSSLVGGQAMKRGGSGGSRVPSRLSTQAVGSPNIGAESSAPGTPPKPRTSLHLRTASNVPHSQTRGPPSMSRPLSRQSSKEAEISIQTHSRQGSIQQQVVRSPGPVRAPQTQDSDSEEEVVQPKGSSKRLNPQRSFASRKDQMGPQPTPPAKQEEDSDEDEDSPSFLPFANPSDPSRRLHSQQDPSATLRGGFSDAPPARPIAGRRSTSERITSPTIDNTPTQANLTSSTSSVSSNPQAPSQNSTDARNPRQNQPSTSLSPRYQNAMASVAGVSSRRRTHGNGSDTSPSMGSSFSDLDDTSVTQSALEEALLSGMGSTTTAMGGGGGVASRVSGISQALRSRYFETRQQSQAGQGERRESER